jgi:hypothetical protein
VPRGPAPDGERFARWSLAIYLLDIHLYRIDIVGIARWLAKVEHDLIKRLLWPARDRRDLGGLPAPGELVVRLIGDEGEPITPAELWRDLAAELPDAPADSPQGAALGRFGEALARAVAAGEAGDVAGVLALDQAFTELARSLEAPRL